MRMRAFRSSTIFQSMKSSMSGWSMSRMTILAARRVVPPDLMAPAARSPMRRKLITPDDLPPPDSGSFSPRSAEKLEPVPEPYLHRRASRTHSSMIPPPFARLEIDVVVALRRAVDTVGPMQAGVEPLRRVGRAKLRRQHVAHLVVVGLGVGFAVEIAAFPAPIGPGAGEPVENFLRRLLAA